MGRVTEGDVDRRASHVCGAWSCLLSAQAAAVVVAVTVSSWAFELDLLLNPGLELGLLGLLLGLWPLGVGLGGLGGAAHELHATF